MLFLTRHHKLLLILLVTSALVICIQIFSFKTGLLTIKYFSTLNHFPLLLPTLIFIISFLPLMYLNWFKKNNQGLSYTIKQIFFWILTIVLLVIWVTLAQRFFT